MPSIEACGTSSETIRRGSKAGHFSISSLVDKAGRIPVDIVTTANVDSFGLTMSGLEAGLRVHHIAAFDLKTCNADDSLVTVLKDVAFADFDQIPVRDKSQRIVGVLLRTMNSGTGSVAESMEQLHESLLVSAEAPLMSFVRLAGSAPYKLVLNEHGIKGIVTRSDLLKLPVRLLAFACITHLETLMADVIRTKHPLGDESWLASIPSDRQKKVRSKEKRLKGSRMDIDLLELTDFGDKRELARSVANVDHTFAHDAREAEDLRNQIAHAATFITSEEEARQFAVKPQKIQNWIARLQAILSAKVAV